MHKRSFKVVFTEAKWTWRCHQNHMQDTVSLTMGNFGTKPTINWKPITGPWITLQNTSPFIHSIHHCHIDHNAPCLPPPPPKFYITVVFDFAWDDCNTQEELETMVMQFFFGGGGGGIVNKVQEPAIQSCDTGQQIAFFDSCQLTIIWISTITFCVYKRKLYLPWTRTEASKSRSL